MKGSSISSIHLNSKKSKIILVSRTEGLILYNISPDFKINRVGNLLNRKTTKKDINVLDAQWSNPIVSPDGSNIEYILYSSAAKIIRLINAVTVKVEKEYKISSKAQNLLWNPHNFNGEYFLSGHDNGFIYYWNKDTDAALFQFHFMNQISAVKKLAFNPIDGGIFACGHEDGKIFIWNMENTNEADLYFQVDAQFFEGLEWHPKQPGTLICGTKNLQVIKINCK